MPGASREDTGPLIVGEGAAKAARDEAEKIVGRRWRFVTPTSTHSQVEKETLVSRIEEPLGFLYQKKRQMLMVEVRL